VATSTINRILILGKTGLIGHALFETLKAAGTFDVHGFSSSEFNLLTKNRDKTAPIQFKPTDAVVMTAGITRLKANTFETMVDNIRMIEALCDLIEARPVGKVVFISSVDVYGTLQKTLGDDKISEKTPLHPDDYYAIGKVAGEFLLKNLAERKKIPLVVLRLPGIFGPHANDRSAIGKMIRSALVQGEVCVHGDGQDTRDFVYIDNVIAAIRQAVTTPFEGTVNVVSARSYTIQEIAQIIKDAVGSRCKIVYGPQKDVDQMRKRKMHYDPSGLRQAWPELMFRPLPECVDSCIQAIRAQSKV
jgi:nucleoside-diphosphate-sugar epimerase